MAANDKTNTKTSKSAEPVGPTAAIKVVCATPGFRRGGRAWGPDATTVPVSEFKPEQLDAIRAEPRLIVVDVEIDAAATAPEGAGTETP